MKRILFAAAAALSTTLPAFSHATLEVKQAELNSTYKAVMRIGHGCNGQATLKVRITIPEGVISVKPMPKAGWELTTIRGDYAKTYDYYGSKSEGVKEIIWTGSLEDQHYDEFVFRGRITDAFEDGQTIHFPTVQQCADGSNDWVEIPAEGQDPHDLDGPAPALLLNAGGHAHH